MRRRLHLEARTRPSEAFQAALRLRLTDHHLISLIGAVQKTMKQPTETPCSLQRSNSREREILLTEQATENVATMCLIKKKNLLHIYNYINMNH